MEFPDRKYLQGNAAEPQQESIFSGLPEEMMLPERQFTPTNGC